MVVVSVVVHRMKLIMLLPLITRRSDVPFIFQGVMGVGHWIGIPVDLVE